MLMCLLKIAFSQGTNFCSAMIMEKLGFYYRSLYTLCRIQHFLIDGAVGPWWWPMQTEITLLNV